jgi:hypothetical protein
VAEQRHANEDEQVRRSTGTALKRRGILAAAGAVVAGIVAKQASVPVAAGTDGDVVLGSVSNSTTTETGVLNSGPAIPGGPAIHGFRSPGAVTVVSMTLNAGVVGQTFVTDAPGVLGSSPNGSQAKGVYGTSGSGSGVYGESTGSIGVQGQITGGSAANTIAVKGVNQSAGAGGFGVYGSSVRSFGGWFEAGGDQGSGGVVGVARSAGTVGFQALALSPATTAGFFSGSVSVLGSLGVTGGKFAVVQGSDGQYRGMYAVESPECWFEDFGTGTLAGGKAEIKLDPQFAQHIHTDQYHVFISEDGDHNGLHTTAKNTSGFTVEASSLLAKAAGVNAAQAQGSFSWRVVAKRNDIKGERMPVWEMPQQANVSAKPHGATPGVSPLPKQK